MICSSINKRYILYGQGVYVFLNRMKNGNSAMYFTSETVGDMFISSYC